MSSGLVTMQQFFTFEILGAYLTDHSVVCQVVEVKVCKEVLRHVFIDLMFPQQLDGHCHEVALGAFKAWLNAHLVAVSWNEQICI
jgi:hypothetical protein